MLVMLDDYISHVKLDFNTSACLVNYSGMQYMKQKA